MRSAMPEVRSPSTRGDSAVRNEGRPVGRVWSVVPRPTVANRLTQARRERPARQISQPRQPTSEPTAAAIGTPISRGSDWPLITQPSARPRWLSATRPETSANATPVKAPQQPPAIVAHTPTQKNEPACACAARQRARANGEATSKARRPMRSDSQPPKAEATPQETDVSDTRLATSCMETSRSRAISSRNGARVVPLEVVANEPRQAAPIRAQGRPRETAVILDWPRCRGADGRKEFSPTDHRLFPRSIARDYRKARRGIALSEGAMCRAERARQAC